MFIGLFEIALGLWLLMPFQSFAPTLHIPEAGVEPIITMLTENQFGIVMITLGVVQIAAAWRKNWSLLMKWTLPTVMFWVFVTMGYIMALPESTNVVILCVYTLWVIYQHLELSYFVHTSGLRNKENVGII